MRIANIISPGSEYQVPVASTVSPDATVVNVPTRAQVLLATDPVRIMLRDLVYLEAGLRAEAEGHDAVFVNTVGDFGLDLIRDSIGVPVVGAGASALAVAAAAATAFSIVTVWPSSTRTNYDRVLARAGLTDRCVSMRFVLEEAEMGGLGGGAGVMDAVKSEGNEVAARVLASCRNAVSDGAAAIVLGCSCMAGLSEYLQRNLDVLVVDPLAAGYAAAEAAARRSGASPGLRARRATDDTVARVESAVSAWESLGASLPSVWAEDCGDACAVLV
jgi:Asp/Glu/hydantoin racemase